VTDTAFGPEGECPRCGCSAWLYNYRRQRFECVQCVAESEKAVKLSEMVMDYRYKPRKPSQ
jgi:hypothetical protein